MESCPLGAASSPSTAASSAASVTIEQPEGIVPVASHTIFAMGRISRDGVTPKKVYAKVIAPTDLEPDLPPDEDSDPAVRSTEAVLSGNWTIRNLPCMNCAGQPPYRQHKIVVWYKYKCGTSTICFAKQSKVFSGKCDNG